MAVLKTDVDTALEQMLRELASENDRSLAAEIRVALRAHVLKAEMKEPA